MINSIISLAIGIVFVGFAVLISVRPLRRGLISRSIFRTYKNPAANVRYRARGA